MIIRYAFYERNKRRYGTAYDFAGLTSTLFQHMINVMRTHSLILGKNGTANAQIREGIRSVLTRVLLYGIQPFDLIRGAYLRTHDGRPEKRLRPAFVGFLEQGSELGHRTRFENGGKQTFFDPVFHDRGGFHLDETGGRNKDQSVRDRWRRRWLIA